MSHSETSPIEALTAAVQEFVNARSEHGPVLLRGAVVVWEQVRFDDDGQTAFHTSYACTEGTSPAASVGILELGRQVVLDDLLDDGEDE